MPVRFTLSWRGVLALPLTGLMMPGGLRASRVRVGLSPSMRRNSGRCFQGASRPASRNGHQGFAAPAGFLSYWLGVSLALPDGWIYFTRYVTWTWRNGARMLSEQLHLTQCEEEREGGLGSLVLVDAVFLEAVAAAAGLGVVEFQAQVVAAQEPLEGEPRLLQPDRVVGGLVGFEAGRNGGDRPPAAAGRTGPGRESRW